MKKRIFAVLIATLLLCACLPLGATSVSAATSGDTGSCRWWMSGTELNVSGYGAMENYNVQGVKAPWGTKITLAILQEGVTSVGVAAFEDCTLLERVTLPDSVTAIRERAFQRCRSLKTVFVPAGVTEISNYTFADCEALSQVYLRRGVTAIGTSAFENCGSLTALTLPDSVTTIGDYAFRWCAGLTAITIPDTTTTIGAGAFYHCDALASLTLGHGVAAIGDAAFEGCGSLTKLSIPSTVTGIGYAAFRYCDALTDVYYDGTAEDWQAITMGEDSGLDRVTVHFSDGTSNRPAAPAEEKPQDKKKEHKNAWAIIAIESVLVLMVMCLLLEWRSRKKKQKDTQKLAKKEAPLPQVDVSPYLGKKWCHACGALYDGDVDTCSCGSRYLVTLTAENAPSIVAQMEGAHPAPEMDPTLRLDPRE